MYENFRLTPSTTLNYLSLTEQETCDNIISAIDFGNQVYRTIRDTCVTDDVTSIKKRSIEY